MRNFVGAAILGGAVALGVGMIGLEPATAQTVIVKKVRGVCYDSDGDRISCRRAHRSYHYSDSDYRREPGVSLEFGTRDRRYRNRDRD